MTQSRISWNVNGADLPHIERLEKHIRAINPRWLLVMDNTGICQDYARKFPNTNIIARNWGLTQGDENVYSRLSPQAWLDARFPEATDGIWLYTANEAGINAKWDVELMKLILSRNLKHVKLVMGNPSVGTPALPDWTTDDKREWFRLLHEHRDQFVLGLHEYFCGIAPSGFVGGYPDGSWNDGRTNLHPNYEDRRNWPDNATTVGQLWHCGRLVSVNNAARSFGFMPPRIVITEHGADDLADMHGWLRKFQASGGKPNIRGWKTLSYLWAKLLPNVSPEMAYFENVSYLDRAVYARFPNVEAQLLFTWTGADEWNQFDLSDATEFQGLLETYVQTAPPVPIPPKPETITVPRLVLETLRDAMEAQLDIISAILKATK